MKIIIAYSSKWSVSFANDESKKQEVVSLKAINEKNKNVVILNDNDSYEDVLKKVEKVYKNFKYRSISQNTVLGIVSRLLGETRYLNDALLDKEHIINKLKDKITFDLHDRSFFNEIIRIETPLKEVQNNGGGLISKENEDKLLLYKNDVSELIYSVLNLKNLEDIYSFVYFLESSKTMSEISEYLFNNGFLYKGNYEIIDFLCQFEKSKKATSNIDSDFRKYLISKLNKVDMEENYESNCKKYQDLLFKLGIINYDNADYYFNANSLNISGILCYTIARFIEKNNCFNGLDKLINKNGIIRGIAKNSGKETIKDIYTTFAPSKKVWSSPYFLSSKYFNKKECTKFKNPFNLGITKEDGVLEINIDINEKYATELKQIIDNVAVSTFSLGKKGLAYVQEVIINE